MPRIPGSLHAFLASLIDYAGLYPPACLPLAIVLERYNGFLQSPERWMLNRLVLPASVLGEVKLEDHWRISLLVDEEPGPLPPQVETLETKAPVGFSRPTYCEAPVESIRGGFAKIRMGGPTPEAIPATERVAQMLAEVAARRLPFKATAGLHHPVRSLQPLTYEAESPRALVHGFFNVFTAAIFAWRGMDASGLIEILEEKDPGAFVFGEEQMRWRGRLLSVSDIRAARSQFAHSFGSCSFEEPVSELRQLGFLP